MAYKLVLFDFDGVFYDQKPMRDAGIRGMRWNSIERHYNHGESLDHIIEDLRPFWNPYEGMIDLVASISSEKGIITNGPTALQRAKINHFGAHKLVNPDLIFISYEQAEVILKDTEHPYNSELDDGLSKFNKLKYIDENYTAKPNPYMVEKAIKQANCKPSECIMIGDQDTDITAAKLAGAFSVKIEGIPPWIPSRGFAFFEPDFSVHKNDIANGLGNILL